jgi:large subunit ribosomal protein L22
MSDETPKDEERETPEAEAELEPTEADEAAAVEAAEEEEDDVLTDEPAAEEDDEPAAEANEDEEAGAEADEDEEPEAEAEEPEDEELEAEAEGDEPEAEVEQVAPRPRRRRRSRTTAEPETEPAPAPARTREPGELVVVRAQAKYVRTSARKARLVCDHIRGKSVQDARAILANTPRAAARDWSKLLESAVANAEHNHELLGDDLRVAAVTADEGPTLKRFRPRALGRATRIRKRTSHLTILLTPKES